MYDRVLGGRLYYNHIVYFTPKNPITIMYDYNKEPQNSIGKFFRLLYHSWLA